MHGIFTDMSHWMWPFFTFHVGKYTIHGSYGLWQFQIQSRSLSYIFSWPTYLGEWKNISDLNEAQFTMLQLTNLNIFINMAPFSIIKKPSSNSSSRVPWVHLFQGTPPLELIRTKIYVSRPNQLLRFSRAPAWPMDLGPDATKMGSNLIYLEDHPS